MTVSTEGFSHSYFPAGNMEPEAIPFQFLDPEDVNVTDSAGVLQVMGTDYVITGSGRDKTASITALRIYADDVALRLYRETAQIQETKTEPFKPLPGELVELELDRRALVEQELQAQVNRAIRVPRWEAGMVLPAAALRANKYLAFDAAGGLYLADLPPVALPMWQTVGVAAEGLDDNDFVNIFDSGSDIAVRQATAADPAKFAHGFVLSAKAPGQPVSVIRFGVNPVPVLDVFGEVWLSATNPGKFVTVAPDGEGQMIQSLGSAVPGEGIFFTYHGRVG